jgi:hypothetical protein
MARARKKQSQGNLIAWLVAVVLVVILILIARML